MYLVHCTLASVLSIPLRLFIFWRGIYFRNLFRPDLSETEVF